MIEEGFKEGGKKSSRGMTDLARKILLTGVGAIFMTEESLRKTLADLKVPTDAVGGLVDVIKKQKDGILEIVAVELSKFFSKVKVHEELQKALKGMQIQVEAKISFEKGEKGTPTKITVRQKEK